MKFFNRARKFVYFSNLDARVNTVEHYDVFAFEQDQLDSNGAEYVGTFAKRQHAQFFVQLPRIYEVLHDIYDFLTALRIKDDEGYDGLYRQDIIIALGTLNHDLDYILDNAEANL